MLFGFSTLIITLTIRNVFAQQDGLLIPTPQGLVIGTLTHPSVREFLGVPYASAKRWEAPSLPSTRSTPFSATKFSDSCLQVLTPFQIKVFQISGVQNSTIFVPESEDCLTVNIWTPNIDRKQSAAVLLWVYGGGLQFGTSNFPAYNGTNVVRDNDDVLLVTFNYRLNIFGFPNSPQLISDTRSQNFGLLDLDAVVQWVHDNIAAFGGDPERIVLFGQSAGGSAIDAYALANPQDTRVKGIIEQSGNLGVLSNLTDLPVDPLLSALSDPWNTVADAVGCGNVADAAQLTCMKQVPARQLVDAVISVNTAFFPASDGITIFADFLARSAAGNFLHVPLLSGSTKDEGDLWIVAAELFTSGDVVPGLTEIVSDLETQLGFTCPVGRTALDTFNANVPTWRYEYQGIFPDISVRPDFRAFHTAEIPLVFGTMPDPTNTEKALSKFIQSAWVAFARDPNRGLLNLGWPRYSPDTDTLAQIGNPLNQTGLTFTQGRLLDFTCNSIPTLLSASKVLTPLLPL